MANNGEAMGLLAYWESLEKIGSRRKMYKDFLDAYENNNQMEFSIWTLSKYSMFVSNLIKGKNNKLPFLLKKRLDEIERISQEKNVSLKLDSLIRKTARKVDGKKGLILRDYLRRKQRRKDYIEYVAEDDDSSVLAFLINSEIEFQKNLLEKYK